MNDVLRQTSNVQAGPFVVDDLTALTRSGVARMVVRDSLGRETVIVQPFFTHVRLLEKGLSDWSLDAGAQRFGIGTAAEAYGTRFASGIYRYGASKTFTLECAAQLSALSRHVSAGAMP